VQNPGPGEEGEEEEPGEEEHGDRRRTRRRVWGMSVRSRSRICNIITLYSAEKDDACVPRNPLNMSYLE
jgi:hypothetical protein